MPPTVAPNNADSVTNRKKCVMRSHNAHNKIVAKNTPMSQELVRLQPKSSTPPTAVDSCRDIQIEHFIKTLMPHILDAISTTIADEKTEVVLDVRFNHYSTVIKITPSITRLRGSTVDLVTGEIALDPTKEFRLTSHDRALIQKDAVRAIRAWYRSHRSCLEDQHISNLLSFGFRRGRLIFTRATSDALVPVPAGLDRGSQT